ncbi:hypothetical protein DPQ33_01645 [Oceanidesulfovibrio indonesiensis]|uniref:Uncharacterized protein n=2 Tax=Oceanidesulfovibrio indonesiensis TaxID=54767 RepID=A0A7M3MJK1_9BACT|nr:hypothetical protein DPQ33_01645 [Oceanidesulfovibrio indonesiensis]
MMLANRAMLDDADEYLIITEDASLAYDLCATRVDPWPLWQNVCAHLGLSVRWHVRNGADVGACLDLCRVYLALQTPRLVWLDSDARLRARPQIDMREHRPHLYRRGPLVAFYSGIQCEAVSSFWRASLRALAGGVEQSKWLPTALRLNDLNAGGPWPAFSEEYVVHHFRGTGVRRWRMRTRAGR